MESTRPPSRPIPAIATWYELDPRSSRVQKTCAVRYLVGVAHSKEAWLVFEDYVAGPYPSLTALLFSLGLRKADLLPRATP
jgi:hypothetical protein